MDMLLLLIVAWIPAPLSTGFVILIQRSGVLTGAVKILEQLTQPFTMSATLRNAAKLGLCSAIGHTVLHLGTPTDWATVVHV